MSLDIQKNELHYYVDLLRSEDSEQRTSEYSAFCVKALHNVIRTMKVSRHTRICGENFTRLDFGYIPLNNVAWSDNGENASSFNHSIFHEWNFAGGHTGRITAVAWANNGMILTGGDDSTAIIWDSKSGFMLQKLSGHLYPILSACFSTDGKLCITGSNDGTAKIWDTETGRCLHSLQEKGDVVAVAISKDGQYCVTASSHTATVWKINMGFAVYMHSLEGHTGDVRSVSISPDSQSCLTGSFDQTAKLWDISSGKCIRTSPLHNGTVTCVLYSPDGKTYMSCSDTHQLYDIGENHCDTLINGTSNIWCADSGDYCGSFTDSSIPVEYACYSADGELLCLVSDYYMNLKLYDARSRAIIKSIKRNIYTKDVCRLKLALSPDLGYLLVCNGDVPIQIVLIETGACINSLQRQISDISTISISNDGKYCLSGYSLDSVAHVWDFETGKLYHHLEGHTSWIIASAISPDSKYCLTASDDGKTKMWELESGKCIWTIDNHASQIIFSADGKYFISADFRVVLRDAQNGGEMRELYIGTAGKLGASRVRSIAVSEREPLCLIGSDDHIARLINYKTGSIQQFIGHTESVECVAFSPDGKYCLTGAYDFSIKIWDIRTGNCIGTEDQGFSIPKYIQFTDDRMIFLVGMWGMEEVHINMCSIRSRDDFCFSEFFSELKAVLNFKIKQVSLSRFQFPYIILPSMNSVIIHKLKHCDFDVEQNEGPDNVCFPRFLPIYESLDFPKVLYHISNLRIKNCSMNNIVADMKTREILYQYGADIQLI